jgi:hypothetical protein
VQRLASSEEPSESQLIKEFKIDGSQKIGGARSPVNSLLSDRTEWQANLSKRDKFIRKRQTNPRTVPYRSQQRKFSEIARN